MDRDLAYEFVGDARYAAAAVDRDKLLLPWWRRSFDVLAGVV